MRPLHVVASYNEVNEMIYIITVYEPSLTVFQNDFKTRRL